MKRALIVAAAAFAFASPPPAAAQEPRLNERGCSVVADMVLVARSLALERVDQELAARIMEQIYVELPKEAFVAALRAGALKVAYARTESPPDLARLVGEACVRTGGDRGAMFGTRIRWRPAQRRLET